MQSTSRWRSQWTWIVLLLHCILYTSFALDCDVSITATPSSSPEGRISAPGFPSSSYPREDAFYTCTYTLASPNTSLAIRLEFSDFHLDHQDSGTFRNGSDDYLLIDLRNGLRPYVHTGVDRPGIVLSPGQELVVTLGVQALGADPQGYSGLRTFSAQYSFVRRNEKNFTDLETFIPAVSQGNGNIAHTVLAPSGYPGSGYSALRVDIIWYIEAPPGYKVLFTFLEFTKTSSEDRSTVEIRDGLTSQADTLYLSRSAMGGYHVTSTQGSLYVRWKGATVAGASLEAEFTYFTEAGASQCPLGHFQCNNDRCIHEELTCNLRNNCGDTSDEDVATVCRAPIPSSTPLVYADPCLSTPCLNGGTCLALPFRERGFICQCSRKFLGELCEIDRRRTTTSPACNLECLNNGVCQNGVCQCPDTFYGIYCQNRNSSSSEFSDLQHTSIMIGAFVGAVCLLSVCWLIAMAKKRYQDEPQPTGRISRIVSVHTPDELGLRRNTTVVGEQDIPPEYSVACRRDSRQGSLSRLGSFARRGSFQKRYRPSIDSVGPLSPPPSYEVVVTGAEPGTEDSDGIIITIPEAAEEEAGGGTGRNLPDVVTGDQPAAPVTTAAAAPPPAASAPVLMDPPRPRPPSSSANSEGDAGEATTLTTVRIGQNTLV